MPLQEKKISASDPNTKLPDLTDALKPKTPAKATPTKTPRRNKKLPNTKENNQSLLTGFFKAKVVSTPSKTSDTNSENDKFETPTKPTATKAETTDKETLSKTVPSPVTRSQTLSSPKNDKVADPINKTTTSPVSKPKARASPRINSKTTTSPTTQSMTKTTPVTYSTDTRVVKSPVTRSKTATSLTVTTSPKAVPKQTIPKQKITSKSSLKASPKLKATSASSLKAPVPGKAIATKAVTPKQTVTVSTSAVPKTTPVTTNESTITTTRSPPKKLKTSTSDMAISCDLDQERHDAEDKVFLKTLKLSTEQLKLKESNPELFWEQAAEAKRVELAEYLEDNKQVDILK